MRNFYKVMVQGSLGRDPESRFVPSGQQVTNFSVAVNDDYNTKDGEIVKKTIWFKAVAWGNLAEISAKYLSKGSKVLLVGKLTTNENGEPNTWTGKDGNTHASFEINVAELYMLGGGEKREGSSYMDTPPSLEDEEELPF